MTLYKWSQMASADATADPTINWAEGQAPSSVNDSARSMMAAVAKYRDDVSGAIVTGGTSTAYTVSSYQVFQSLAQLNGQVIAFTPHVTNGTGSPNVSLNVDGLGAKTIRADPSIELPAGVLVAGTPYAAVYNNASGVFYLRNFFGNPYNVPIGASVDFWGATTPNSSFALMYGQAISRSTYSTLFSLFSTAYGSGDGSSTFNIPDLRGRVVAGKDDMGGTAASRLTSTYFGASATTLGAVGGAESKTLVTTNLPSQTPSGTIVVSKNFNGVFNIPGGPGTVGVGGTSIGGDLVSPTITAAFTGTAFAGQNSTPLAIAQPTIVANKLLRII